MYCSVDLLLNELKFGRVVFKIYVVMFLHLEESIDLDKMAAGRATLCKA